MAPGEVEDGVPQFLTQLSETLRLEATSVFFIETEDQCGGIPAGKGDLFQAFGDRRGSDRSGLGLGPSIARKAVRAHGGEIRIRNMPGKGCVFIIDVPLAAEESAPQAVS